MVYKQRFTQSLSCPWAHKALKNNIKQLFFFFPLILFGVNGSYWDEQTNNTTANASFWEDEFTFESSGEEYIIDEDDSVYFGSSAEEAKGLEYQIEEALLAKVAQENDSKLFSMGHQFKDFVFECSYRGYDCR